MFLNILPNALSCLSRLISQIHFISVYLSFLNIESKFGFEFIFGFTDSSLVILVFLFQVFQGYKSMSIIDLLTFEQDLNLVLGPLFIILVAIVELLWVARILHYNGFIEKVNDSLTELFIKRHFLDLDIDISLLFHDPNYTIFIFVLKDAITINYYL